MKTLRTCLLLLLTLCLLAACQSTPADPMTSSEATAESSNVIKATFIACTRYMRFHKLYRFIARSNIYACLCVAFRSRIFHFFFSLSDLFSEIFVSYLFA